MTWADWAHEHWITFAVIVLAVVWTIAATFAGWHHRRHVERVNEQAIKSGRRVSSFRREEE